MSLRAFHIVFILLSILLLFGFGYWQSSVNHSAAAAGLSMALGALLAAYLVWFISKIKKGMRP